MKSLFLLFAIFSAPLLISAQSAKKTFKAIKKIEGTWFMETKRGKLYESWIIVDNNKMQGKSYRLNGADTLIMERVELVLKANDIFYTPNVSGQNNNQPVSFKLISSDNNAFIFENKEHDFPQRIIYHLKDENNLLASIEGNNKGKFAKSEFPYSKLK